MLTNDELARADREHWLHPATHWAQFARGEGVQRVMTGGEGCEVVDRDGRRFLDAFAGLYCVNVGYGRTEIAEAMAEQARDLAFYHAYVGHGSEAAITLASMALERAPDHMAKVYFGLGGSDANETNVKLAWFYWATLGRPEKRKIIGRWRGYHGSGVVSGSMTGLPLYHRRFGLPLPGFLHVGTPDVYRRADRGMDEAAFVDHLVDELERTIAAEGAETIAAFVGEPVMATGGIVPPPEGYWPRIQEILRAHEILLIADEVVTGFGRTGTMFASPAMGIEPDLMTLAKGLTSAYAPLSASLVSRAMWEVLERGSDEAGVMGHGWTYSAHPVSAAAGVANLRLLDELGLVDRVAEAGEHLRGALRDAVGGHRHVGDVRGAGLLAAVELMADPDAMVDIDPPGSASSRIVAAMAERGVIARAMPHGNIVGFAPPFCLTREEADRIAAVTADALAAVF